MTSGQQPTATILLFPRARRGVDGKPDLAALIQAAIIAGKVRRIPAGERTLAEPAPALVHLEPTYSARRPDLSVYDGEDGA
jgi:hypothetical protein